MATTAKRLEAPMPSDDRWLPSNVALVSDVVSCDKAAPAGPKTEVTPFYNA
jgi:hypothetical protein